MRAKVILKRLAAFLIALAICLTTFVCTDFNTVSADSSQKELEDKLKDIGKQLEEVEDAIKETKNDISKEKEHQENIQKQIDSTEEYLRTLTDLIAEYNMQIEALESQIVIRQNEVAETEALIAEQQAKIDENIEIYKRRLRAMYLSGNDSVASILMGATDFFDMLMKIELVTRVADYNNNLIEKLLTLKDEFEKTKLELEEKVNLLQSDITDIETKRADVEVLSAEWDEKLEDLEDLYSESKAHIQDLKDKQEAYEEDKEYLEDQEEKLEEEIQKIIREAERKEYLGDLEEGTFLWPVSGFYYISSPYGSRWGTKHRGIDIAGSGIKNAKITAANSGEVIYVYNGCDHNYGKKKGKWCGCGGGFGNYCIVDHGGGYTTVYGHAKEIVVKKGQKVTTGDLLGYVGTTGNSTGYHLHFEIRVDGDRLDPESFNLIKK